MHRRSFVRTAGATGLLPLSSLAAGCSRLGLGGTPLAIETVDSSTTATGDVTVSATISNPTEQSQQAELTSQVDIQDGDTYTKSQEIEVPPNNENSYTITHDLSLGESFSADQYEFGVSLE